MNESSSGVKTTQSEMRNAAFVALVKKTPNVSVMNIKLRIPPNIHPLASSDREIPISSLAVIGNKATKLMVNLKKIKVSTGVYDNTFFATA